MKWVFAFVIFVFMVSCTSLHKKSKYSEVPIDRVLLAVGLKVKHSSRPFSCDSYDSFFASSFAEPLLYRTLKCLNGIKEGNVTYSYQFKPAPHLVFDDSTKAATCMKEVFPTMAIPRELYFVGQSQTAASWECYAVNLNSEADEVADIKLPWDRFKLEIQFPLSRQLKTRMDLQIWLMVTLLESMKSQMGGTLKGTLVTENVCKRCYKDTPWYDEQRKSTILPVYWP